MTAVASGQDGSAASRRPVSEAPSKRRSDAPPGRSSVLLICVPANNMRDTDLGPSERLLWGSRRSVAGLRSPCNREVG